METLLERTNEALKFMKIDPNNLIRTQNLYRTIPGNNGPTIVGTILEYFNKDGVRTYAVYTITGWAKEWPINKGDILDMIWSMEYNEFTYPEIAQILNISQEVVEEKHREACKRKLK